MSVLVNMALPSLVQTVASVAPGTWAWVASKRTGILSPTLLSPPYNDPNPDRTKSSGDEDHSIMAIRL